MYFRYFVIISPWKGRDPSFEQTWIPFIQGYFVPSLVKIGPVVLEKKMKMWKVFRQTDRQTDRLTDGRTDRRRTTGNQKSYKKNIVILKKSTNTGAKQQKQEENSKLNTHAIKKYQSTISTVMTNNCKYHLNYKVNDFSTMIWKHFST